MTIAPLYCRSAAYELFAAQLKTIEETDSLLRAAVAVSLHELPNGSLDHVERTLDSLAAEVQGRVKSGNPRALVAQLHHVLFEEFGLRGNSEDYYSSLNSYIPQVLERRMGIPVTLGLVYKCVAQRMGLTVRGINSPVHFLVAVQTDGPWMMVDPYHCGRLLTEDEAFDQMERLSGATITRSKALLTTATHLQWISRIIRNLEQIFQAEGRRDDELAMRELLATVSAME